jgi:pyruvate dehydrogenase E2 component (dihydrolipoamide acetyltransferase)
MGTGASPSSLFDRHCSDSISGSFRTYSTTSAISKDYPDHILFPMPALSPTMESGTIASWVLKEGDSFAAGDVLCSIETDKATMDYEAQDDGILAKILKSGSAGADLPVGTPICVVVEDEEDVAAFADFTVADEPSVAAESPPAEEAPQAAASPPAEVATTPSSIHPMMPSARFLAESK